MHRSPAQWAGRSSRREASLNRSVDSAPEPSVRLNEAAFAPVRRSKNIFGVRSTGPERLLPSRRIHEGMDWGAAARKRKDRLQEASRQQTVTTANEEKTARTALGKLASPAVAQDAASPRDFQGMTPVSNGGKKKMAPSDRWSPGARCTIGAPSARISLVRLRPRRAGFRFSGHL